ncbi:MAG: ATP-binding protein, partial [Bdellovibrionales bacterium]
FLAQNEIFKVIKVGQPELLESAIFGALENHNQREQQQNLHILFNDQNSKLLELKRDLESRINKREQNLNKAKKKLVVTNHRIQAMHEALISLNRASSLSNMENLLNNSLADAFDLIWIRVVFSHQKELIEHIKQSKQQKALLSIPLYINSDLIGYCYFARSKDKKYTKDEKDFLQQISETIAIAIDRISKKELSEKLRNQWVTTFNAIADPICITDGEYNIVQTNQSFTDKNFRRTKANVGQNAFYVFFGAQDYKDFADLIKAGPFEWERTSQNGEVKEYFQTQEHDIELPDTFEKRKVLIFHDITKKRMLERQIIESSKLAELGTISSSIAHELNNPLGGMLNFLQLIKMDLPEGAPETADVDSMIQAGLKCKEIIENLLGFSRKTYFDIDDNLDLNKVLEKALQFSKLQTKYQNINIELVPAKGSLNVKGDENQLIQAIRNILQNSVEAIEERLQQDPNFDGQIRIEAQADKKMAIITISDNGPGVNKSLLSQLINPLFTTKDVNHHTGLGLTIAHQIIDQHGGKLEIFTQPMAGTSVKLSLIQSRFEGPETSF